MDPQHTPRERRRGRIAFAIEHNFRATPHDVCVTLPANARRPQSKLKSKTL